MSSYKIVFSHGLTSTEYETYEDACEAVHSVYKSAEIGHDGDISEGGQSTLCWASEEDAEDDDGQRACCKIVKLHAIDTRGVVVGT